MQRSIVEHDTITPIMPIAHELIEVPVSIHVPSSASLSAVATLDGGSMINTMSPMLAAEAGLKVEPLPNLRTHGVTKVPVTIYGHVNVLLDVRDANGVWKSCDTPFVVIENPSKPLMLGSPWLAAVQPRLNYFKRTMRYTQRKASRTFRPVDICSVRTFLRLAETNEAELYSCHVSDILGSQQAQSLPEWYKDRADVFSRESSAQLSENGP